MERNCYINLLQKVVTHGIGRQNETQGAPTNRRTVHAIFTRKTSRMEA
jgi:hypothetical protein